MVASFDTHIFWEALTSEPYWKGALLAIELTVVSLATACVLGFFISLHELLTASQVRAASDFRYVEAYTAATLYYLVIVSVLMVVQAQLERRFTWKSAARRRRAVPIPAVAHDAR